MGVKNKDQNSTFSRLRYLDKQLANPNLSQKEIKILKMREQNLMDMLEDGQDTFSKGGKVVKKDKKIPLPKPRPRHANPKHPMNTESTGPSTTVKVKRSGGAMKKKVTGYDKGGAVTKDQKLAALRKIMSSKGGSSSSTKSMEKMLKDIGFPMSKKSGGSMKPVPAGKKGLAKLPKPVRNKMGYAKKGGPVKAAKSGGSCRGGGSATRGKGYSKA